MHRLFLVVAASFAVYSFSVSGVLANEASESTQTAQTIATVTTTANEDGLVFDEETAVHNGLAPVGIVQDETKPVEIKSPDATPQPETEMTMEDFYLRMLQLKVEKNEIMKQQLEVLRAIEDNQSKLLLAKTTKMKDEKDKKEKDEAEVKKKEDEMKNMPEHIRRTMYT